MTAAGPRRSVEVEYWVVDESGRLTDPEGLLDAAPGVEREFVEPLVEIKTSPCETTAALRTELLRRIGRVLRRGESLGKRLVPLGTPVDAATVSELPAERTRVQNAAVGESFAAVRHCAGTHVHVEQAPGHAVDQLNVLTALDPALALANSSPYVRGERVAAGARSVCYRWRAYEGVPHQGRVWPYLDDRGEWDRRLERRYEEFVTAAIEAGVDRRVVAANFDPESAVWTPVQLRETFGTVEWRSPDATLPQTAVRLADHLADVVGRVPDADVRIEESTGRVGDDEIVLPTFDVVLDHVEAAVEAGLRSPAVRAYLDRMGFDVAAYDPATRAIDGHAPVDGATARRIRLARADALEREVSEAEPTSTGRR